MILSFSLLLSSLDKREDFCDDSKERELEFKDIIIVSVSVFRDIVSVVGLLLRKTTTTTTCRRRQPTTTPSPSRRNDSVFRSVKVVYNKVV